MLPIIVLAGYWIRYSGIFLSIEISAPYMIADTINVFKNVLLKATLCSHCFPGEVSGDTTGKTIMGSPKYKYIIKTNAPVALSRL